MPFFNFDNDDSQDKSKSGEKEPQKGAKKSKKKTKPKEAEPETVPAPAMPDLSGMLSLMGSGGIMEQVSQILGKVKSDVKEEFSSIFAAQEETNKSVLERLAQIEAKLEEPVPSEDEGGENE